MPTAAVVGAQGVIGRYIVEKLAALPDWAAPPIHQALVALAEAKGVGLGKVAQPLRVAITGGTISPPIDQTAALLGREQTLRRLAAVA